MATDGKNVYFATTAPMTLAEYDARCTVNPDCPMDWAIYKVQMCR